ncbi:cysteine proteinase [Cucurbitaria berberidis CBS 394.84]|uniref:ubiquitinyl hydrolase 1 n=1 Tax=Cucurbitaria berberidis CBS 394.84 TaxID=1168544 RepID=A0A9P4LA84_9PLEO|nr:cysteine proteinase [Cucurbitaria berberidis CBS 394.84]KAF1847178.1 cysteine proteinase [Cucurbitaria berberidis CBS 394.84]
MSYEDYPEFEDYQRRWITPESTTTLTSVLLAVVAGAYIVFKVLGLLGYPVWLWIHQLAHMSVGVLRLRGASLVSTDSESSDDTMQRSGGMLGSIFGLNPGSLLQKGVRGVAGAWSRGSSAVPPGLGNISNSCYQNSVIQGLASLPSLREYLSRLAIEYPALTADTTNGALYEMISKLNDPGNHSQHFWIRGKLKSMSTFQQQDAQEYYSKVLDALDEEVKKASSSKRRSSVSWLEATKSLSDLPEAEDKQKAGETVGSEKGQATARQPKIVPNPLDGLLAQRVGCVSCGYSEGLSLIPFNCVTVSLGRNYGYDIRECLDEYTTLEYIDGVECAKCTLLKLKNTLTPLATKAPGSPFEAKLNAVQEALDEEDFEDKTLIKKLNAAKKNWVQSTKSKQAVIARAPKSLVLHINRSSFNEMTGMSYKNTAGVSYPMILDLANWCLGSKPSGSQQPDMSIEEWPRDPRESMLPDSESEPVTTSQFQYRLRAAVTHYGSHGSGHYVCYRPHPRVFSETKESSEDSNAVEEQETFRERWWRFSDESVYAVSEEEAHQGNVFMLFYERIDELISLPPRETDLAVESIAVAQDAPLPPANVTSDAQAVMNEDAAEVPLPDDDDIFDFIPPDPSTVPSIETTVSSQLLAGYNIPPTISMYPTPPPEKTAPERILHDTDGDNEMSEADSEDALSTQLTSDYDSEADIPTPPTPKTISIPPVSPHLMRTAGNAPNRGQGSRQSLPLVSAT